MTAEKMKILISNLSFGKIESNAIRLLRERRLELILNSYGKKLNEEELFNLLDGGSENYSWN